MEDQLETSISELEKSLSSNSINDIEYKFCEVNGFLIILENHHKGSVNSKVQILSSKYSDELSMAKEFFLSPVFSELM